MSWTARAMRSHHTGPYFRAIMRTTVRTFPVSIGDGVNGIVAVVDGDKLAAVGRRRRVVEVFEDAGGPVVAITEGESALGPRHDQVVARFGDLSLIHI